MPLTDTLLQPAHPSWHEILRHAMTELDLASLENIYYQRNAIPPPEKAFAAFSMPLDDVQYILFGESPYPRKESATGYAFMDGKIDSLWSDAGLSKEVNRATSLRNFIKMLLVTHGYLNEDATSKLDIIALDKSCFIQTICDLQNKLIGNGILLLNTSLSFTDKKSVKKDSKLWIPFIDALLNALMTYRKDITLILFGAISAQIQNFEASAQLNNIAFEHPYNISFIKNKKAQAFFRNFNLLHP